MGRVLVVANKTLSSAGLIDTLVARGEAGDSLRIVVPLRIPSYADLGGMSMYGFVALDAADASAIERDGRERLESAIDELADRGLSVTGRVYGADAFSAIEREFENGAADEVLLSSKARPISRWLRLDLQRRLMRRYPGLIVSYLESSEVHADAKR